MARLHALELSPDETGAAAVVAAWQQLADVGLPSQLRHQGVTNAPHVTVLATPDPVSPDVVAAATRLLTPLLPVTVLLSGLIVFGGSRPGLAWALEVPDELLAAVIELRGITDGHRHQGWLPHVTLARRLRRSDVGAAWAALEPGPRELRLTTVRHWDPEQETIRTVHHAGGPDH